LSRYGRRGLPSPPSARPLSLAQLLGFLGIDLELPARNELGGNERG